MVSFCLCAFLAQDVSHCANISLFLPDSEKSAVLALNKYLLNWIELWKLRGEMGLIVGDTFWIRILIFFCQTVNFTKVHGNTLRNFQCKESSHWYRRYLSPITTLHRLRKFSPAISFQFGDSALLTTFSFLPKSLTFGLRNFQE